jgi:hypothetical protein
VFNNAAHALRWAYNVAAGEIVKMSGINRMREESAKGAPNALLVGLDSFDLHGQAGQIIGLVERLSDQTEREYIAAKFGRRLDKDDLTLIVFRGRSVIGFGPEKTEAVYRIMRGYFDGSMPHRAVRRELGCRDQYAVVVRSALYETLDLIHDRALADMTEIFQRHELIQSYSSNDIS